MKKTSYILSILAIGFFFVKPVFAQNATGMSDAINQMGEREIQNIQQQWGHLDNIGGILGDGLESLNSYIGMAESAIDLYNALQTLDRNECTPDFVTNANAMMPTGCRDQADCASCYQNAISRMTVVRRSLGRLSCIYANTKKFTESAIAFGDNVSGIHGVMGLAWQHERKGIQDTFDSFKNTYDKKYTELMNSLQIALQEINTCENQFGLRDWYQKFGFMYFEMMKEKYKRTD